MVKENYSPLFESKAAKGRRAYKIFAASVFVAICYICFYRLTRIPAHHYGRCAWIGLSMSELWFVFSWFLSQFSRWNPVYHQTFKDRLSHRYDDNALPGVDVFVCTADPKIEPPIMVVNTVLSVMAYDYPPDKLTVYLSDDACSDLTFYALLEASKFAIHWLPFCNKFKVEPRSPQAYFSSPPPPPDNQNSNPIMAESFMFIKKEYQEMEDRIERASMNGNVPSDSRQQHTAFRQWDKVSSRHDHPTILQILIHGDYSQALPTLVYLAREKNPKYHHNFKAGAMNALIRVSSIISNGSIMLNVDCDMYSNNSESIRDMLCFFLDEKYGKETAYVQYPQGFFNLTKNDLYSTCFLLMKEIDMAAMDGNGGPCYIGSGCFHRRDTLCGLKYEERKSVNILEEQNHRKEKQSIHVLEETSKVLANCIYEENTQWGKEIGVLYGFPAEDAVTGAYIQSKGWKSKYFNPTRKGFLGSANTSLLQSLIQHKRWSEGLFLIFLSKLSPLLHGGRIPLKLRLNYSNMNVWAVHCLATLYYVTVPSFCLFQRISLFPEISSRWVIPFAYVFVSSYVVSLGEFLSCGGTLQGWWNEQRMLLFRRTTSYFFGFIDSLLTLMGIKTSGFVVTAKVSEDDVNKRYMKEVMEFGASSPMFTILATIAMFNLYSFVWRLNLNVLLFKSLGVQILLSGMIVFINLPIYEGLFFRKDNGKMPFSVTWKSVILALLASTAAIYL